MKIAIKTDIHQILFEASRKLFDNSRNPADREEKLSNQRHIAFYHMGSSVIEF